MTTSKICDGHLTLRNCRVRGETFHILNPSPPPRLVCWLTKENYLKPLEYVSQVFSFVVMLFVLGIKISHGYRHADFLPGKPIQVHGPGDLGSPAAPSSQGVASWARKYGFAETPTCNAGDRVWSLGRKDLLERGMAVYSSVLAWKILQIEEPGRLQSVGYQQVRHDWTANTFSPIVGSKDFIALISSCAATFISSGDMSSFLPVATSVSKKAGGHDHAKHTSPSSGEKKIPSLMEVKDRAIGDILPACSH